MCIKIRILINKTAENCALDFQRNLLWKKVRKINSYIEVNNIQYITVISE